MRKLSDRRGYYDVSFQIGMPSVVDFTGWRDAHSFMCVGYGPNGETALHKAIEHIAEIGFDAGWLRGTMSTEYLRRCRSSRRRRVYCIVWFDKGVNGIADETYVEEE